MSPFVQAVWDVLVELAPWLLIGSAVAGLLHVLLPHGLVERQLSGRSGVLKAVLVGIPLPLCSCSVIPAGLGLRSEGASRGASVGFVIATPQTGVDSILVAASFLGWPFALFKVGAALVTGVLGGWWVDTLPQTEEQLSNEGIHDHGHGWWSGVSHAVDLIRMIWRWLVIGVLLSAFLTVALPPDALGSLAGQGVILGFLLALLVSLPLYVCATASVPIAAALVAAGLPTGAALVFLMAGPATNLATLGAMKSAFGTRVAAAYLTTLVVGSVAFGLAYEGLFGTLHVDATHAHAAAASWEVGAVVVLLMLFVWFTLEDVYGWWNRVAGRPEIEVDVTGLTCKGCASKLQRNLLAHEGVEAATVSFADGRAMVQTRLPGATVHRLIEESGFGIR